MKRSAATTLCLALILTTQAHADDAPKPTNVRRDGWYLAPMGSFMIADKERHTSNGFGFAPMIGHRVDDIGIEAGLLYNNLGSDTPGIETQLIGGNIDLMIGPFETPDLLTNLYGVVGFGARRRIDHPRFPHNDTTILGDAGLGLLLPLKIFDRDWGIRTEARYRFDVQHPPLPDGVPRTFHDWIVNVGLQIPLSSPPPPPPPPPAPHVVPAPPPLPPPPPKCEQPQVGQPVALEGCKSGDVLVLQGVTFAVDKSDLDPGAITILDGVADALNQHEAIKVGIAGHTDNSGSDRHNQKLSEARAASVRAYLITKGVAGERMTATGYGEMKPVDSNDTAEGRARNRRVEMTIQAADSTAQPASETAAPAPSESSAPAPPTP